MDMTHLPEHPHAFIIDGILATVAVFHDHDEDIIERVRQSGGYHEVVSLCEYGETPLPASTWNGQSFTPPS